MESKEMNSRVWDLFNVIRGKEDITKVIPAAIVVTRVKKKHLDDYEKIYEVLREEASRMGVYSLFENQGTAIDIYGFCLMSLIGDTCFRRYQKWLEKEWTFQYYRNRW